MLGLKIAIAVAAVLGLSGPATAGTVRMQNGEDTFIAGAQVIETVATAGDTFMAGRTLRVRGDTAGDLHVSGYDVSVDTETGEDLYAFGGTVVLAGTIAGDLTAAGFTVRTGPTSRTDGNARLFGNSVTIEGPVDGALLVTGRDVSLNAAIAGDVRIVAQTLSFGPEATVGGTLTYSTEDKMDVPARVAPESRVVFDAASGKRGWQEWDRVGREIPGMPTFATLVFGFVISLLFFVVLGAVVLGFLPYHLARMRRSIADAPGQTLLVGVIGLSMLFGMVPITALTIVGLPFAPIVLLGIVVAWTLGYALGAYSVAMRLWSGLGGAEDPGTLARLLVFAAALTCIALLNFIPFVGWVANYTLVLLGIGAMTRALFQSLLASPDAALDVDMKPIGD